jgi:hypothetical protein
MAHDATISAAAAATTGVSAWVLAALGVHPQALAYALFGSVIGATFAPKTSRWRAAAVFVAVVASGAELGSWIALSYWPGDNPLARNGCALVLSMLFHPLLTVVIGRLPALGDRILGTPPKEGQ